MQTAANPKCSCDSCAKCLWNHAKRHTSQMHWPHCTPWKSWKVNQDQPGNPNRRRAVWTSASIYGSSVWAEVLHPGVPSHLPARPRSLQSSHSPPRAKPAIDPWPSRIRPANPGCWPERFPHLFGVSQQLRVPGGLGLGRIQGDIDPPALESNGGGSNPSLKGCKKPRPNLTLLPWWRADKSGRLLTEPLQVPDWFLAWQMQCMSHASARGLTKPGLGGAMSVQAKMPSGFHLEPPCNLQRGKPQSLLQVLQVSPQERTWRQAVPSHTGWQQRRPVHLRTGVHCLIRLIRVTSRPNFPNFPRLPGLASQLPWPSRRPTRPLQPWWCHRTREGLWQRPRPCRARPDRHAPNRWVATRSQGQHSQSHGKVEPS